MNTLVTQQDLESSSLFTLQLKESYKAQVKGMHILNIFETLLFLQRVFAYAHALIRFTYLSSRLFGGSL